MLLSARVVHNWHLLCHSTKFSAMMTIVTSLGVWLYCVSMTDYRKLWFNSASVEVPGRYSRTGRTTLIVGQLHCSVSCGMSMISDVNQHQHCISRPTTTPASNAKGVEFVDQKWVHCLYTAKTFGRHRPLLLQQLSETCRWASVSQSFPNWHRYRPISFNLIWLAKFCLFNYTLSIV